MKQCRRGMCSATMRRGHKYRGLPAKQPAKQLMLRQAQMLLSPAGSQQSGAATMPPACWSAAALHPPHHYQHRAPQRPHSSQCGTACCMQVTAR